MMTAAKKTIFVTSAMAIIAAASAFAGNPQTPIIHPQAFNYTGLYDLTEFDPNLTGLSVKYAIVARSLTYIEGQPQNDYRPNINHNAFANVGIKFHDRNLAASGISPHSTAICSVLLGNDPNAYNPGIGYFHYKGATPLAQAEVHEFWHFVIENIFPNTPPEADIITASFGTQLQEWWTKGFDSMAQHHGLVVIAAIGNGSDAADPPLYPAAGANAIGVGVVDSLKTADLAKNLANFALAQPEHSTLGPTDDGRCKPDIIAPGNCLAADANGTNKYKPTGNWSSFSTPVVAGTAALLIQKAKTDPNYKLLLLPEGKNCAIKAILLNSAEKLPYWHKGKLQKDDDHNVPLDYIQGAGMLDSIQAYKTLLAGPGEPGYAYHIGWDLNYITKKPPLHNFYEFSIEDPNDKYIDATVTWNKNYQPQYPFEPLPHKDKNLTVGLYAVDPQNPDNTYLLDYSDSPVDNVEHIHCPTDPAYDTYRIVVSYSRNQNLETIPKKQLYAVAWDVKQKPVEKHLSYYDLNADGTIDNDDVVKLIDNWLTILKSPNSYQFGDLDDSGSIDSNDLNLFLNQSRLGESAKTNKTK